MICLLVGRYAIKGSPNQKLLLEDIYYAIESRVRSGFLTYLRISRMTDAPHYTVPLLSVCPIWLEG